MGPTPLGLVAKGALRGDRRSWKRRSPLRKENRKEKVRKRKMFDSAFQMILKAEESI
jgi:hypothetical protein